MAEQGGDDARSKLGPVVYRCCSRRDVGGGSNGSATSGPPVSRAAGTQGPIALPHAAVAGPAVSSGHTASTDACCHERHEPVGESEAACRVRDDADPSAARRRSEDRRPARSREAEESYGVHHPSGAAVHLLVRRLTPKLQLPTSKVSDWELDRWALGVDWRQFLTAVLSSSHPG